METQISPTVVSIRKEQVGPGGARHVRLAEVAAAPALPGALGGLREHKPAQRHAAVPLQALEVDVDHRCLPEAAGRHHARQCEVVHAQLQGRTRVSQTQLTHAAGPGGQVCTSTPGCGGGPGANE